MEFLLALYVLLIFLLTNGLGLIAVGTVILVATKVIRSRRNIKTLKSHEKYLLVLAVFLLIGQHFVTAYFDAPKARITEYEISRLNYDIYIPHSSIGGSKEVSRQLISQAVVSKYSGGPMEILYEQDVDDFDNYMVLIYYQSFECIPRPSPDEGCKQIGTNKLGYPIYVDTQRHMPGKQIPYNAIMRTDTTFIGVTLRGYVDAKDIVKFFNSLEKTPPSKIRFYSEKSIFFLFP